MSRQPSLETQLRSANSELRRVEKAERGLRMEVNVLRGQLTKAQQDVAEWKRRFDALLTRDSKHEIGVKS